jgi:hypothetical protein
VITLVVMLIVILVGCVSATVRQLDVPAGEEVNMSIDLAVEDRVLIKFSVLGLAEKTIDFSITNPDGDVVATFSNQGNVHHSFVCEEAGEYILTFSNKYSSVDKTVTLDYEIQHYIFGIPQMLFMTMIIVIICLLAVAVFVMMGNPR